MCCLTFTDCNELIRSSFGKVLLPYVYTTLLHHTRHTRKLLYHAQRFILSLLKLRQTFIDRTKISSPDHGFPCICTNQSSISYLCIPVILDRTLDLPILLWLPSPTPNPLVSCCRCFSGAWLTALWTQHFLIIMLWQIAAYHCACSLKLLSFVVVVLRQAESRSLQIEHQLFVAPIPLADSTPLRWHFGVHVARLVICYTRLRLLLQLRHLLFVAHIL